MYGVGSKFAYACEHSSPTDLLVNIAKGSMEGYSLSCPVGDAYTSPGTG